MAAHGAAHQVTTDLRPIEHAQATRASTTLGSRRTPMLGSDATTARASTPVQIHTIPHAPLRLVRLCHTAATAMPKSKAVTTPRSATAVAPLTLMKVAVLVLRMGRLARRGDVAALDAVARRREKAHRLTGKRYAVFDERGYPCAFTSTAVALQLALVWPRVSAVQLTRHAGELRQSEKDAGVTFDATAAHSADPSREPIPIGTRSAVIRWVNAHVAIPDLLAEIAPTVELKKVGKGYLSWCPFRGDRAPDEQGRPGTPSFFAVRDRRYGWSWRCYSTNCAHSSGLLRHSFRLLQDLLGLTVSQAIREARARWPAADTRHDEGREERGGPS
jgi:hypothetical protein